jgi:nucleoside-diphosphate-sugar epimerase
MRALITGGAGFIGSHLADALLARGDSSSCSTTSAPGA